MAFWVSELPMNRFIERSDAPETLPNIFILAFSRAAMTCSEMEGVDRSPGQMMETISAFSPANLPVGSIRPMWDAPQFIFKEGWAEGVMLRGLTASLEMSSINKLQDPDPSTGFN